MNLWRLIVHINDQILSVQFARTVLFATVKRETAYLIHVLISALCFSPFLLFGETLFANTDLVLHNYPMILLAKRQFLSGSIGLWNSFVFLGAPQSVAASTHILNPENWLLFLVPEPYLFSVYTFSMLIKFCLIGIFSYSFFCAELHNRRWALFASITYHLSGWMIWALVSSVALSIYFYYTLLLSLLWSFSRRSYLKNYLFISAVLTMMLMAGNIAHATYALLSIGLFFLYRAYSLRNLAHCFSSITVFALSVMTSLLVFSIRLLPILETLASGARDMCLGFCQSDYKDTSVLIARLFNTEIFGISYSESILIFKAISPVLKGYQIHGVMPGFFGIAAMLLALWALVSEKTTKAIFWSIGTIILLGLITAAKPFDELALMLFGKFLHPIGWQLSLPVTFAALAATGGMSLEKSAGREEIPRSAFQIFIFVICCSLLLVLMILIRNEESLAHIDQKWVQLFVGGLFVFIPLSCVTVGRNLILVGKIFESIMWCIIGICLAFILLFTDNNPTFISHVKHLSISLLLFAGIIIILMLILRDKREMALRLGFWGGSGMAVLAFWVCVYPWTDALEKTLTHGQALKLAGVGTFRLFFGIIIFLMVIFAVRSRKLSAYAIYLVLMLILLCEQIPANKVHMHINANPFYASTNPYPVMIPPVNNAQLPINLDLKNYRVNFPNTMLQIPFYKELFGQTNEVCSSVNVAYGIRSYGGFNNTIPNKTIWFIQNWVPEAPDSFCVYAKHTEERFLDLSGVGYAYDPLSRTVLVRPNALSRFMLYSEFELVRKDTASLSGFGAILDRLKAPDFKPLSTIILEEAPGFPSRKSVMNGKKIFFREINSDHIEVDLHSDGQGLLFFNDTYNTGWLAEVNGVSERVLEANYAFMAVPVPAGNTHIVLKYKPRSFTVGLYCAVTGVIIWLIALIVYWYRRKRVATKYGSLI